MRRSVRYRPTGQSEGAGSPEREAPPSPPKPSFATDIKPLFEPFASAMMWRFDLTDYEAVLANCQTIADRLGQDMPPPPFPLLTDDQQALFARWIANGCPR